jgi:hypothetical protein
MRQLNPRDVAVIIDPYTGGAEAGHDWADAGFSTFDAGGSTTEAVRAALETQPEVIVTDGDDRLVGRVITEIRRVGVDGEPAILPVGNRPYRTVGRRVGRSVPGRGIAGAVADELQGGDAEVLELPTLRVTSSTEPAPRWGFNLGAGILFPLFEAHHRAGGEGWSGLSGAVGQLAQRVATAGSEAFEPRRGRIVVDGQPWGDSLGYLLVSSLDRSWLGLEMSDQDRPTWVAGKAGGEFVRRLAKSRALPGFLSNADGRPFDGIQIDWSEGCVLDGDLVDPGRAHVLDIRPGEAAKLLHAPL